MRLYLDTEFNGFGGELISMGIASEAGDEWYRVLQVPKHPHAWVAEHVLPFLEPSNTHYDGRPVGEDFFAESLHSFLRRFPNSEFIADWPADFEHLCSFMTLSGSQIRWRVPIECTMRLIKGSPDIAPEIPHNALSDARALRDWHLATTET